MKKFFNIIRACKLFENISDENLMTMLNCLGAKLEFFEKKHTVFAEGMPAKHMGILLSGSAQMIEMDYYGNRSILSVVKPSEVVLEAFACAEMNQLPVAVVANEPSDIMLIESSHMLHTCSNNCQFHQQLIFNLMKLIANKAVVFHEKIEIISKRSTKDKLMAYLAAEAKKSGSKSFDIPFDRQELADFLEVDRSGLSSEISKLKKEKIIKNHKNHFTLL